MKVGIIGMGRMGKAFVKAMSRTDHEIFAGSRDPQKAFSQLENCKISKVYNYREVIINSEIIILTVRWKDILDLLKMLGSLEGKILIDVSNPINVEFDGLLFDSSDSAAETISRNSPGARVVKAFNPIPKDVIENSHKMKFKSQVFYCSDDDDAKEKAAQLIRDINFEPVSLGGLASARLLESLFLMELRILQNQDYENNYGMIWKNLDE